MRLNRTNQKVRRTFVRYMKQIFLKYLPILCLILLYGKLLQVDQHKHHKVAAINSSANSASFAFIGNFQFSGALNADSNSEIQGKECLLIATESEVKEDELAAPVLVRSSNSTLFPAYFKGIEAYASLRCLVRISVCQLIWHSSPSEAIYLSICDLRI